VNKIYKSKLNTQLFRYFLHMTLH